MLQQLPPAEPFVPSRWLPGGHLQTLWRKFRGVESLSVTRQRLELPDGDFIDLDWAAAAPALLDSPLPLVLLVHGLCGSSASGYIRALQVRLTSLGFPAVAMNFRGCSGELNRLARAYHSGVAEDLQAVYASLRQAHPHKPLAVVGYSLGANVSLKWQAEYQPPGLQTLVAVSTPFALASCSAAMKQGTGRFYGRFFLRRLVADTRRKLDRFRREGRHEQADILAACGDLERLRTLWDFDDQVTAPLHGFADADDYYRRCSSREFLHRITAVPTLLIQGLDDPIIPAVTLPSAAALNNNIHVDWHAGGGHVGFVSRHDPWWLEHRIIRFIAAGRTQVD